MWYVYILQCNDGSFYTGVSNDLNKRVTTHRKGVGAKYTSGKKVVKLVYYEKFSDKKGALKREIVIKGLSRANKKHLIKYPNGHRVSLVTAD